MYLNHTKIWIQRIIYGIACALLTTYDALMSFVFILTLISKIDFKKGMTFLCYILIIFIFLDVICIKALIKTFQAEKMNGIFQKETNGLLSIEAAAKAMKMSHHKFMIVFIDCLGRDLLKKCALYAEDPTYILLENGANDIREKYAVIHCSQCGAPNVVRIGFSNHCKYCSTIIKTKRRRTS